MILLLLVETVGFVELLLLFFVEIQRNGQSTRSFATEPMLDVPAIPNLGIRQQPSASESLEHAISVAWLSRSGWSRSRLDAHLQYHRSPEQHSGTLDLALKLKARLGEA